MRRGFSCGLAGALAMGFSLAAAAQSPPVTKFELTPFGTVVAGGEFEDPGTEATRDLESSGGYGLTFDFDADGFARQYQIYYSRQGTELQGDDAVDVDVEYLHVGGILGFPRDRVVPYIVGTLGATRFSPAARYDDETRFSLALGGGVKIPIGERVALRLEARGFLTFVDSDSEIFCVSAGGATCLVRTSGSSVVQYQALAGLSFRF